MRTLVSSDFASNEWSLPRQRNKKNIVETNCSGFVCWNTQPIRLHLPEIGKIANGFQNIFLFLCYRMYQSEMVETKGLWGIEGSTSFLKLGCLVASRSLDIWVSTICLEKSNIGWPQQLLTKRVSHVSEKMDFVHKYILSVIRR